MENTQELINKYKIPVVEIDGQRDYWLVRTQAGEYHEEFYFDSFIAIGWDEFCNQKDFENPANEDFLKKVISNKYPESKQPGLIYNQIKRFFTEMKPGDIVMIPTTNSTHISFGKINSTPYIYDISQSEIEEGSCPFKKRIRVDWIKTVKKSDLDPYLYKMMNSHHTINDANAYENFIDRTLHSFYIKNNIAHLVININKQDNIGGLDFFEFGFRIIDLASEVKYLGLVRDEVNKRKDIQVKSNVQSPGIVEFISHIPEIIFGVGIILTFLVGGKIEGRFDKEEKSVSAESKGLFHLFTEYKKQKGKEDLEKMKLDHQHSMDRLNAKLPEELQEVVDVDTNENQDDNFSS